jgi:hypothetical protein
MRNAACVVMFVVGLGIAGWAQQAPALPPQPAAGAADVKLAPEGKAAEDSMVIPPRAKVFVAPMPDNFDEFIKAAIDKKQVPVTVVADREQADFEITGYSESQKASTAKKIIRGSWHSRESASIKVANLKSGIIVFAYSYNTTDSAHGKKSSSESCAKHLKEKIESGK